MAVGRVVAGHGVRGMARINPYNPDSPALLESEELVLAPRDGAADRTFKLLQSRPHKRVILVQLAGIDSLDELAPWIGSEVQVPKDSLPEAGDNEHYHWEVIGLEVRTTAGEVVGVIEEVQSLPANDLWVVRLDKRETLVPVVEPILVEVNLADGCAIIDPPDGLIPEA